MRPPGSGTIGGDVRYQLVELAQLGFALLLMFGAFLGGLGVGWWRWGRIEQPASSAMEQRIGSAGLFTPEDRDDDVVVVADIRQTDLGGRELFASAHPKIRADRALEPGLEAELETG